MSGSVQNVRKKSPAMDIADQTLQGCPPESGLASSTDANVLFWCFRALQYLQGTNALHRVAKEGGPGARACGALLAACAPLRLPSSVTDITGLLPHLPYLIRQVQEFSLPNSAVENSIEAIVARCPMGRAERQLLMFGITLHGDELLEHFMELCFGRLNPATLFKVLAYLLEVPLVEVQAAMRSDSFLNRAGLLRLDLRPMPGMEQCIDVGFGVAETLEIADGDWNTIVCRCCAPIAGSALGREDFAHMAEEWDLVLGYLRGSVEACRIGSNVLLHGAPGCGKTEFARAALAASGLQGYELNARNLSGSAMCIQRRRSCYRQASQYLLSERPGVIVVDEMDGMLEIDATTLPGFMGESGISKAAANAQLEDNPVPTIWITNDPQGLDPAQLRRFDLVLGFRRPSNRRMRELLEQKLRGRGLPPEWLKAAAASRKLTPGLVATLSQVAESVENSVTDARSMQQLLDTALRQRGIRVRARSGGDYDPGCCNPSLPLSVLQAALARTSGARCLLHGGTGTGKTAFARYMAEALDLEPHLVRPSEILDPYVGGTERNIARLFHSACPEEELIVLDEFESFAADRSGARHNWQVSQINELLTQLEDYPGRVMACTNIPGYLDPAIRRRFQLKVELLPLTCVQRARLFAESCRRLGLRKKRGIDAGHWVRAMEGLAYGHFANAAQVAQHLPELTPERFAGLLEQEMEATDGRKRRPIGFAA
jgi:AAA+ superfamily predicted ATPase